MCNVQIKVSIDDSLVLEHAMTDLRSMWEETSYQLDKLQANPSCVEQEWAGLKHRQAPPMRVTDKCRDVIDSCLMFNRPIGMQ